MIVVLVFIVLFSTLYLSQLTIKPARSLEEPVYPKFSQLQALEIVLADAQRTYPEVKDLRLFSNQYNYTASDYRQHPDITRKVTCIQL